VIMERRGNRLDRGEIEVFGDKLTPALYLNHKYHLFWHVMESGPPSDLPLNSS
jgi:hypothetical protein